MSEQMTLSPAAVAWMEEQTKIAEQVKLKERLLNGEFQTGLGKEHIAELQNSGVLDEKIKRFGLKEDNIGIVVGEAVEAFKLKKEMEQLQARTVVVNPPPIIEPPVIHQQPQTINKNEPIEISVEDIYDPFKNKEYLKTAPLADKLHVSIMQKQAKNNLVTVTRL